MKKVNISDNLIYVTDKSFKFELEDEKQRQFGVLFEILDTTEFDNDADKDYPFIVSIGIIADECSETFDESGMKKLTKSSLIYDCQSYMGTIPIEHILNSIKNESETKDLFEVFTINQAKKHITKCYFGTIAAQQVQGTEYSYLQFANEDVAIEYIDYMIKYRIIVLSMLIGSILDKPINLAGKTGWNQITKMVKGK